MSQRITTEAQFTLDGPGDLNEDGPAISEAIKAALSEALDLGGHAQAIVSITVGDIDGIEAWMGGALARTGTVTVETRLT